MDEESEQKEEDSPLITSSPHGDISRIDIETIENGDGKTYQIQVLM